MSSESRSQHEPSTVQTGESLAHDLGQLVGPSNVRHRRAELLPFSRDATPMHSAWPTVVAFPQDTTHVGAIAAYASEHSVPLIPRGAGSNLSAATVPTRGGTVQEHRRQDLWNGQQSRGMYGVPMFPAAVEAVLVIPSEVSLRPGSWLE